MTTVRYEIVEHNDGWAYKVGDVFSETFASRDEARSAANRAAEEQRLRGPDEEIEFQDEEGKWHVEKSDGRDRPETEVDEP